MSNQKRENGKKFQQCSVTFADAYMTCCSCSKLFSAKLVGYGSWAKLARHGSSGRKFEPEVLKMAGLRQVPVGDLTNCRHIQQIEFTDRIA